MLHGSPMYFYKRGKGRYRKAPADALAAAIRSVLDVDPATADARRRRIAAFAAELAAVSNVARVDSEVGIFCGSTGAVGGSACQPGALLVANLAQRRDLVRGKPPCFFEDRVDEIGGKITETSARQRLVQASHLLQREANFLDRRAIHGCSRKGCSTRKATAASLLAFDVNVNST